MHAKSIAMAVGLAAVFGAAQAAIAAPGGGGARGGGAASGPAGHSGGMSSGHMSEAGKTNTNAQYLPDSTRGLDRAGERMNDAGIEHEQATSQGRAQGKTKAKAAKKRPRDGNVQ